VKTGTGIVVDDYLRTSVPNIYAAGDCAELFDKGTRTARINFGWRSAIKQGRLAGRTWGGREAVRSRGVGLLLGPVRPRLLDRIR